MKIPPKFQISTVSEVKLLCTENDFIVLCIHYIVWSSQHVGKVDIIIPILQIRKLGQRDSVTFPRSHNTINLKVMLCILFLKSHFPVPKL